MISVASAQEPVGIIGAIDQFIPGGVANILNLGLAIGAILALITIVYAGILYSTSGDNTAKQQEVKKWITSAIKGLVLIAGGAVLLNIINPQVIKVEEIYMKELEVHDIIMAEWDNLSENEQSTRVFDPSNIAVGSDNFDLSEFASDGDKLPPDGINTEAERRQVIDACGYIPQGISPVLIQKLEELRAVLGGKSIYITSGYRTPAHNARVGGALKSQHLCGRAADIQVAGVSPRAVAEAAKRIFNGVGLYRSFVHVDVRTIRSHW